MHEILHTCYTKCLAKSCNKKDEPEAEIIVKVPKSPRDPFPASPVQTPGCPSYQACGVKLEVKGISYIGRDETYLSRHVYTVSLREADKYRTPTPSRRVFVEA